ncbi:MAG: efflux RND transporter permease subunit [Candidatus Thioglobus sp.]
MNSFLLFFINQKRFALVFTVLIISIGLMSLTTIQKDQLPAVDLEVMSIVTSYPGASPEDVEQNVTNPIEDEISNISGIDKFSSVSREGRSNIVVTLSQDIDDTEALKQEIKDAVNRVRSLPDEVVDLPSVIDHKTSRISVLKISLDGEGSLSYNELRDITDDIANNIKLIDGVSEVLKDGYLDREIQIKVDPNKLHRYNLSLNQVINAIEKRNSRYTVGLNRSFKDEKNIVVLAKFDQAESVSDVIIKSTFEGPAIRLKDIAKVVISNVEEKSITRINGKKGFVLNIKKQEKADAIKTVDLIKAKMSDLTSKYPKSLKIYYSEDLSERVRNRLDIVVKNGLMGLSMVLVVLGLFLSLKTAFWVSISIPVALLGTVALLGFTGETINQISLAAMILVLGIVVDDSIIVAESIHHHKQIGEDRISSTLHGFKKVIMPVVTTILTTILAFSSMLLMGGTMGKFIYLIPLVVIFALILSLLEVSIALPAHLAGSHEKIKSKYWFQPIENWFEKTVRVMLKFRYLVVVVFIGVLVWTGNFAYNNMKFVIFPAVGVDTINGRLVMPVGSSLELTESVAEKVEQLIYEVVGEDLDSVTSEIGKSISSKATFKISLVPVGNQKSTSQGIIKLLKKRSKEITEAEKIKFSVRRPGPPQGKDVEINLVGNDNNQRAVAADKVEKILSSLSGVDNINRDDDPGKPRVEIVLDYEMMARLNIDFVVLRQYLKTAFTGIDITNIRQGQSNVNFRVYLGDNKDPDSLIKLLKINNLNGRLVPLTKFINIREIPGEPNFNHFDGQRSVTVSAAVDDEITTSQDVLAKVIKSLDLNNKFSSIRIMNTGGARETMKSMESFKKAFIVAIFGIFLLLALLFNSYSQPMLVISVIPFSAVGVIWAFFLHGETLSFFALLGGLALVGIIVNDSLVMVSHLNYLKSKLADTVPAVEWVAQGAKDRLRAVVLTTLTTLAGVMPLAYGIGGTDHLLMPMALSLGYGLLFGTLMTLILLPSLYLINYKFIKWIMGFRKTSRA